MKVIVVTSYCSDRNDIIVVIVMPPPNVLFIHAYMCIVQCACVPKQLPDTSATRHLGIKTLWDTSALVSRHFDTKNVVQDTST